jgi:hypothetical protein
MLVSNVGIECLNVGFSKEISRDISQPRHFCTCESCVHAQLRYYIIRRCITSTQTLWTELYLETCKVGTWATKENNIHLFSLLCIQCSVLFCDIVLFFLCVLYCSFFLYFTVSACDVRAATLTEVSPCFFFSLRQMPGYNLQRWGTARTSKTIFWLLCMFRSLYSVRCLCVNVYFATATGCQPNCS